jgi:hypothetical protein
MMEQYKGFWISGTAKLIHPFNREWYVAGDVYRQGPGPLSSKLPSFEVQMKELAEVFGLELAKMIVDECFLPSPALAG